MSGNFQILSLFLQGGILVAGLVFLFKGGRWVGRIEEAVRTLRDDHGRRLNDHDDRIHYLEDRL